MARDKRYKTLKRLIELGDVTKYDQLFDIVPFSVIRNDIGLPYKSMKIRSGDLGLFTFEQAHKLAGIIECDPMLIIKIIAQSYSGQLSERKRQK